MCDIDTSNIVFVERVDEIICDVDTRFNSLKFDVEQNSEFEKARKIIEEKEFSEWCFGRYGFDTSK